MNREVKNKKKNVGVQVGGGGGGGGEGMGGLEGVRVVVKVELKFL